MSIVERKAREAGSSMASVFRSPDLRRIQLAWIGSIIGSWAYSVALVVYAYREGGTAAVGLVGVLRFFTSGIAAPLLAPLSDRFPRRDVMMGADLVRAAAMGAAASVIMTGGPAGIVYGLATLTSVAGTPFRPAEKALLPSLASTPEDLVAANIASSTFESVGFLVGPALGGLLLAVSNPETVFAVNGASFLWSALFLIGLPRLWPERAAAMPQQGTEGRLDIRRRLGGFTGGFTTLFGNSDLGALTVLYCCQTLVAGALSVLIAAMGLELLDIGDAGVGGLSSATGIGGLLGAFATMALTGNRRLASVFGIGVLFWGFPFVLVAAFPSVLTAVIALVIVGLANTVVDVAVLTVMQRVVPDDVLGRAFGAMDGMLLAAIGIGAAITPVIIAGPGVRTALLVWGIFPVVAVALVWPRLRAIDARDLAPSPLALLARVPFLAPLPAPVLESLATNAGERRAAAGEVLMTIGDAGDLFYVIESGEVEVLTAAGELVVLGPGEFFGEIALIRDVPRTATVRARTAAVFRTLERDEFVAAVTGHAASAEAAEHVIRGRAAPASLSLTAAS
jgi:MFS family permease